jgi:hypothetical protein
MLKKVKAIKPLLIRHAKHVKFLVRPPALPERYMHADVPYFSQWESPELAKQLLNHELITDDDPQWKASGATTKQEYQAWSWSGCGMACTKMLLAHWTHHVVPLVELGKKCAAYGGYIFPLETSPGLFYKPYLTFVKQEFGWNAHISQGMTQIELMHELSKGNYIIAGVSPLIRTPERISQAKGGHLILLLGYDMKKRLFYFHNPSGISKETQAYAAISYSDFKKFFSGRGIVIQGNVS